MHTIPGGTAANLDLRETVDDPCLPRLRNIKRRGVQREKTVLLTESAMYSPSTHTDSLYASSCHIRISSP